MFAEWMRLEACWCCRAPFNCPLFVFSQTEIKNHMFFSPINWDDLNAKKITPPFNPNVVRSHFNAHEY